MTQAISPPLPSAELIAQKKNLMPPVPAEDDKRIKRRQRRAKSIPSDMSDYIKHLQLPLDSATNNFGPLSHLIWVPAHKHPQIAPSEFAAWLQTYNHSNETLGHGNHELGRKRSNLSRAYTPDELADAKGRADVFDRYSSKEDDSPVLVPRDSRSLSRRSALSSRSSDGRRRRSLTEIESSQSSKKSNEEFEIPSGGITLYDQPVTMSEWVDLGDASLQDNLFSRVQDQAWTKAPPPPPPPHHTESTFFPPPPSLLMAPQASLPPPPPPPPPPVEPTAEPRKRRKSLKQTVKRKKSWIAGLFQQQQPAEQPQPSDRNKKKDDKKGFGSLISRSLSLSGRKKKALAQDSPPNHGSARPASEPLLLPGHHRLPIHTERAIYRLSHIKLSNPRRPLAQQVLISNFMFWYMSIQQYPYYYFSRQQQLPPRPAPPPHYHPYGQQGTPL